MTYKDEAKAAQSARNKRMGIDGPVNKREADMKRGEFAHGGAAKHKGKGATNVHVNIMPKGDAPPMGGMPPMPPMAPPMAGPPGPPPPMPPGPPGGMGAPPPGPGMMRARGGKVPHMTAGAESGPGRLQKAASQKKNG